MWFIDVDWPGIRDIAKSVKDYPWNCFARWFMPISLEESFNTAVLWDMLYEGKEDHDSSSLAG